ncbi:DNA polymerase beta superfamily protein [Pleionea sp. CnH1-48]|uniref:nucleotidyltransferase domain-containing protein n=1 Tax=Pleionea sp. CnH1-48 TaxID=2954494 RepID=UPI002096FB6A|nr:nucleotidyltransferase domain-containing protein [Pleionea sp. CnH1-48]
MASVYHTLRNKGFLKSAPEYLTDSVQYEVIMGSMAYGVSNDSSDMDVYGFAIPPKEILFPYTQGKVLGFDDFTPEFEQLQEHHIQDKEALGGQGRVYDITLYSITKFFRLLTTNNPNIIDSLYVPDNCVLHITPVGRMVRDERKLFLHKGCWAKFKGYAYSQLHKVRTKQPQGKRKALVEQFGYDVKFAYHIIRLLGEVEQLLLKCDMSLTQNKEQLKSIRRGEWSEQQIFDYFEHKSSELEHLYLRSSLPDEPNIEAIRSLLLNCLEQHYGSLDNCITSDSHQTQALKKIEAITRQALGR